VAGPGPSSYPHCSEPFHDHSKFELGPNVEIINETGLEAQYLELEITESAAVSESLNVVEVLHELKKLGLPSH
jgi:EAL domain-containing protein (putative c-di-GMP-specific phosphodiesterase class I)